MITRTPSSVSEVWAMDVASTTFLRPGFAGAIAERWSSGFIAP